MSFYQSITILSFAALLLTIALLLLSILSCLRTIHGTLTEIYYLGLALRRVQTGDLLGVIDAVLSPRQPPAKKKQNPDE